MALFVDFQWSVKISPSILEQQDGAVVNVSCSFPSIKYVKCTLPALAATPTYIMLSFKRDKTS